MKSALWFSRHQPTAEQLADAAAMGYTLTVEAEATALASAVLETETEVLGVINFLEYAASRHGAIFGVFAAPIQSILAVATSNQWNGECIPCYAAWNVQRSVDGGKPTFSHKKFVKVGQI